VADYRDLWTDNTFYPGLFPFTIRERMLERECLNGVDLVTTVSPGFASRLSHRTCAPVEVIYNGYDESLMAGVSRDPAFPDDGRVRLVYAGSHYPQGQDASLVMRALSRLKHASPDVAVNLLLEVAGPQETEWQQSAERHGVTSMVNVRGMVRREEAIRMQRDADALLLLDWKDPRAGWIAAKVFEYLASGPPIIACGGSPTSALGDLLRETGRGTHVGTDGMKLCCFLMEQAARSGTRKPTTRSNTVAAFTRKAQSMRMLDHLRALSQLDG